MGRGNVGAWRCDWQVYTQIPECLLFVCVSADWLLFPGVLARCHAYLGCVEVCAVRYSL